jgi:hypothetical protein
MVWFHLRHGSTVRAIGTPGCLIDCPWLKCRKEQENMTTVQVVQYLLFPPILWFFFIGGIFSIVVGIGLVGFSSRTYVFFERMNRWVSFRQVSRPIAVPRDSWPFIERHRRWFALVFIAAGIFSVCNLIWRLDIGKLVVMASAKYHVPVAFAAWLAASGWWFLMIGSVVAVLVGIGLEFFPATIKQVEQWSDRWYSSRHVSRQADVMHIPLDRLALRHPRWLGASIIVVATGNVIAIGNRLF